MISGQWALRVLYTVPCAAYSTVIMARPRRYHKPGFYVKVRYKYIGKMKSVPYPETRETPGETCWKEWTNPPTRPNATPLAGLE